MSLATHLRRLTEPVLFQRHKEITRYADVGRDLPLKTKVLGYGVGVFEDALYLGFVGYSGVMAAEDPKYLVIPVLGLASKYLNSLRNERDLETIV